MQEPSVADLSLRLARVRARLEAACAAPRRGLLGEEKHGYRLAAPAAPAEIAAFESAHGARLPEDHRRFLLGLGASGAGPYWGLMPLDQWADAAAGLWSGRHTVTGDFLARPCPLVAAAALPPGDDPDAWLPAVGGPGWEARMDAGAWNPYQGSLAVADQGSGAYAVLIVTGEGRGRVANVTHELAQPSLAPHASFLSWYEGWLDRVLDGSLDRGSWFGH